MKEQEISWKFIPIYMDWSICIGQEGQEYYCCSNFYNKECIMQKKEKMEELKDLEKELKILTEELDEITKEENALQKKYAEKCRIRILKQKYRENVFEKIQCLKKEISMPKIYRIKPLSNGNLYIEYDIEGEYSKRSMTISPDSYPCNRMNFCGNSFSQAYISVCGSKICWSAALFSPICIDIEEIIKHY